MSFENAKGFLKDKGIEQKISFKDGKAHEVELITCEKLTITDPNSGNDIEGISWKVKENGEEKSFFTTSISLINSLSGYSKGSNVRIKLAKKNTDEGFRSFYQVNGIGKNIDEEEKEEEIDVDSIPI